MEKPDAETEASVEALQRIGARRAQIAFADGSTRAVRYLRVQERPHAYIFTLEDGDELVVFHQAVETIETSAADTGEQGATDSNH